ncbi:hypothetical protein STEG23_006910 [Scotinomys teguina]
MIPALEKQIGRPPKTETDKKPLPSEQGKVTTVVSETVSGAEGINCDQTGNCQGEKLSEEVEKGQIPPLKMYNLRKAATV